MGFKGTAQKMKFSIENFFSKCDQVRTADLVIFVKEILNGKLHFLGKEAYIFSKVCYPHPWILMKMNSAMEVFMELPTIFGGAICE